MSGADGGGGGGGGGRQRSCSSSSTASSRSAISPALFGPLSSARCLLPPHSPSAFCYENEVALCCGEEDEEDEEEEAGERTGMLGGRDDGEGDERGGDFEVCYEERRVDVLCVLDVEGQVGFDRMQPPGIPLDALNFGRESGV